MVLHVLCSLDIAYPPMHGSQRALSLTECFKAIGKIFGGDRQIGRLMVSTELFFFINKTYSVIAVE